MKENVFTVDLGKVSLTEAQRHSINAAIQKAVAGELGNVNLKNQIALIPIRQPGHGPIINGIIAASVKNIEF